VVDGKDLKNSKIKKKGASSLPSKVNVLDLRKRSLKELIAAPEVKGLEDAHHLTKED